MSIQLSRPAGNAPLTPLSGDVRVSTDGPTLPSGASTVRQSHAFRLAILPFLIAAGAQLAGPRPIPCAAPIDGVPALAFDEYLVDYGPWPLPPRSAVSARFGFTNQSDVPVTITDLVPSCGCMNPELKQRVFQPGERGEFVVRVQTATQAPGPNEYTMRVRYQDSRPREVGVAFKVVLPEQQVLIEPRSLLFYQLGSAETSEDVVITDLRSQKFDIRNVQSSSDMVRAVVLDEAHSDDGTRTFRLKVTAAATVPSGRTRALVNVFTTDETYPVLQIPILLHGPREVVTHTADAGAAIQVDPPTLIMVHDGDGQLTGRVTITSASAQSTTFESIKSVPNSLNATFESTPGSVKSGASIQLTAHAAEHGSTRPIRGLITVRATESASPVAVQELQIPVIMPPARVNETDPAAGPGLQ